MEIRLTANRLAIIADAACCSDQAKRHTLAHNEGMFTWVRDIVSTLFGTEFHKDLEEKHKKIDQFVDCLYQLKWYLEKGTEGENFECERYCVLKDSLDQAFAALRGSATSFSYKCARINEFQGEIHHGWPSAIKFDFFFAK